jgi:hypothetical protein
MFPVFNKKNRSPIVNKENRSPMMKEKGKQLPTSRNTAQYM